MVILYSSDVCNSAPAFALQTKQNVTESGVPCVRWDTWPTGYYDFYPDMTAEAAQNYCRDPTYSRYLWCYTSLDKSTWGKCSEPRCTYS